MAYYSQTDDISFVPLTVEEEHALFTAFYAGKESCTITKDGKPVAVNPRDELILRHLKFAAKLSLRINKRTLPEDDAIAAGNWGLVQALESRNFDPKRGVRFASYVRSYIKGAMATALRELTAGNFRAPERVDHYGQGSVMTGCRENLRLTGTDTSRHGDAEVFLRPSASLLILQVDPECEERDQENFRREALQGALKSLTDLERKVVQAIQFEDRSAADLARELGISRQAVSQTFIRALRRMRELLSDKQQELR